MPSRSSVAKSKGTPRPAPVTEMPRSRSVLLLVDFINPLNFDGAEDLAPDALEAAQATAQLKQRYGTEDARAIYVNDNFGEWRSDFRMLLSECRKLGGPAARLARQLKPAAQDLTVLKPRHSGFHATPLDLLLTQLQAKELVITGLSTDFCVMCTAMDAYVRGYKLRVPEDCTAAESPRRKREALDWMKTVLKADIRPMG